jgi:hypothetical protein
MDTTVEHYISAQAPVRQSILTGIHSIIIDEDKTVTPVVELMMGKEMIVYKGKGLMKYGLSGMKNYMSLHVMPIYGSTILFSKYKSLLHKASFQKGCINFDTAEKMPLDIVRQLISDCSKVDLLKIRQDYLKAKKPKGKPEIKD